MNKDYLTWFRDNYKNTREYTQYLLTVGGADEYYYEKYNKQVIVVAKSIQEAVSFYEGLPDTQKEPIFTIQENGHCPGVKVISCSAMGKVFVATDYFKDLK